MAAATASGAVARRVNSPRYRSMSSIGTTASPRVMTAAQSASARASVSPSKFCGYASDHVATDTAATTSTPQASARARKRVGVACEGVPPLAVTSVVGPPTTHRRR